MTEINFYVSKEQGLEHRLAVAYRLINLAINRNLCVHIHTGSESLSKKVDDFLWRNEATSFIPHSIISTEDSSTDADKKNSKLDKISISHNFEPIENCDYLINMSTERPSFFSRFTKVAEILDTEDEIITAGRKRYSFYRDRGYTLGYHKL
ncbi:DNA polymerase III subunit chi [Cocleimonas sp. KMM 6892]|uniref:DNA polymerase III subunit chi n=1 Tax=unclassified Cocleimonas TaxID=2639732 RepID=UPI002DBC4BA8|nr:MULTISPECIES: DNA polymerase III subunit chi [unclassified Cocleimonas]MEB8433946.1 DNA polymerase III subunit chi [Cocleimonas sp. KMM 6892]MEC4716757.1 DNA polymerase III subunit chi [Cocleimonas sp. KMM 6895]MEC4746088.1 DNA polymerase III subunit chi [Cocleimonas sp. KMM 6896]